MHGKRALCTQSVLTMSAPSSAATPEKPVYSRQHVAEHSSKGDFWVIINDGVYNLTDYLSEHPGGEKSMHYLHVGGDNGTQYEANISTTPTVLYKVAGKDGTKEFKKYHRDAILRRFQDRLQIGVVSSEPPLRKGFLKKLFG